ncbi:NHL repeat - like 2 [Theobroma cacao]|nr:NHL repeat - like 1 [Theobroma cacao]WRX16369.1 NHL repeat - like 2 [Theobroma cacao]
MASQLSLITLFLFFSLVSSEIILEEGYTVTTVIDCHKLKIFPYSVLALPGSSDLLVLDSFNSHLYTVSFPLSNESEVKRISSGEGKAGLWDGELGQARFNNPRSFALDAKGNVYVADRGNHVIRKITPSGAVTTIAGGYSKTVGNKDGPAQNATFSNDFELAIVAERCILLVVERGSQSVRQIDLNPADCATSSPSGQIFGLGAVTIWTLGLGLSCLLGLFMGILLRPYIIPHEGLTLIRFSKIWNHCVINLGKQVAILCYDIKSAVANSKLYLFMLKLFWLCLSHMSLLFSVNFLEYRTSEKDIVSLLDSDDLSNPEVKESRIFSDQLKDLICCDENLELPYTSEFIFKQGDGNQNGSTVLADCHGRIDALIQANVMEFANEAEETTAIVKPGASSSRLVKRR